MKYSSSILSGRWLLTSVGLSASFAPVHSISHKNSSTITVAFLYCKCKYVPVGSKMKSLYGHWTN